MRYAYADPPYPGMANRYPEKTEVDHSELINRLISDYPDGWALSTGSVQLRYVLSLCPDKPRVRIGAWVKSYVHMRPGVNPFYAWEALLFVSRNLGRDFHPICDWLLCPPSGNRGGILGSKPDAYFNWVLNLLGWRPGDTVDDLYPGTNRLAKIVAHRESQGTLTE